MGSFARPVLLEKRGQDLRAHITFTKKEHALAAAKKFHNITLDCMHA